MSEFDGLIAHLRTALGKFAGKSLPEQQTALIVAIVELGHGIVSQYGSPGSVFAPTASGAPVPSPPPGGGGSGGGQQTDNVVKTGPYAVRLAEASLLLGKK